MCECEQNSVYLLPHILERSSKDIQCVYLTCLEIKWVRGEKVQNLRQFTDMIFPVFVSQGFRRLAAACEYIHPDGRAEGEH